MAKKITLKHALPTGGVITRTTARVYTHVVLVRGYNSIYIERQVASSRKKYRSNYRYYREVIETGVGKVRASSEYNFTVDQRDFDGAVEALRGFATEQEYLTNTEAKQRAFFEAGQHVWRPAGWRGRADLAHKLAGLLHDAAEVSVEAINNGVRS